MSWSPQRYAQSAATLRALEERLDAEESRSERAEVRAVFLEVRLGAAERAVEKASLAVSPDRVRGCLTERLTTEKLCRNEAEERVASLEKQVAAAGRSAARNSPSRSAAAIAAALSPGATSSARSTGSSPMRGVAEQLAVAEARAAGLEAERLALRDRLVASDARAEALAERDALQRELLAERVEREQAEAEAETLELRQRLLLAERPREEVQEVRKLFGHEGSLSEEHTPEPLALRHGQLSDRDLSLQEENAMLRRQLVNEGRRRGRLEARVAVLERERDKLWEQLSTEEAKRVQVEAQAAAFEREWDAARERLAAEQLRRERAEEERNSLLHSPAGLSSPSPESPSWRWQADHSKSSLLSVDQHMWLERLAAEEARREEAEERAATLKDDVRLLSDRLASLEAGVGLATASQVASPIPRWDDDGVGSSAFVGLLPNERARLEWAEGKVLTLERQLAEATHRKRFDMQATTSTEASTDPEATEGAASPLQMADRVVAQHRALFPWKDFPSQDASSPDFARRGDAAALGSLRRELADAKSRAEQEASSSSEEKRQLLARLGAEASRANSEVAEASILRQRLSNVEAQAAQKMRRAVHEEGRALQEQFEATVEAMRRQLDSHQRANSALREELASESSTRSRDSRELSALRERLASSELDAAAQRAVLEERASLQQQFAPMVHATRQRMEASREDCFTLRGQLAAEEEKWLEEASEVAFLRRRLLGAESDIEQLAAAATEEEVQLARERGEHAAEVALCRQRLLDLEQEAEDAVQRAVQEEGATLQQQLAPIVEAAHQQIGTYREDCRALRERLAAEEGRRIAEASQVAALRQQLADSELSASQALRRAEHDEARAARQDGRWAVLVMKVHLLRQLEKCQGACADLRAELRSAEDQGAAHSAAVHDLTRRLGSAELVAQQAAALVERHGGQLAAEEGRSRAEVAEVGALREQLAQSEVDAERSLCRAVQAESAKLHRRFTPIVEASQQQLEACQEDFAAARLQLAEEEGRRTSEAAEVQRLRRLLAEHESLAEVARQDRLAVKDLLAAEEARRGEEAREAIRLREQLETVRLGAQKELHEGRREEAATLTLYFAPLVEVAESRAEAHREDASALRAAATHRENIAAKEMEEERAAHKATQEVCEELQQKFASILERTQEQADAFSQECSQLQDQLAAEAERRLAEGAEAAALRQRLARKDLDLEAAARRLCEEEEQSLAEQRQCSQEAAEASALRQSLAAAERDARAAVRRAVEEESASVRGQLSPALDAAQRQLEVLREECCTLWGQLAAEEGRTMGEAAEAASLRGQLSAAKVEALQAARRAVQEEGAALHQRLAPIVDASREDCFVLRRQLAVEEGTRAAEVAEVAALRQRLGDLEVDAEEAVARAAGMRQQLLPAMDALQQECLTLREELAVEEGQHRAAASEAAALRERLSAAELEVPEAAWRAAQEEAVAAQARLLPVIEAERASEERCLHLQGQLASEREARREASAEAAALTRRLGDAEAGAERAVRGALHEEGAALQRWLAPLLEASQEDCATLREQLAAEESRRRAKAAEVVQLRQRLAASESDSRSPTLLQRSHGGGSLPQSPQAPSPVTGAGRDASSPSEQLAQAAHDASHELRRRLVAEEGRRRAEAAELAAVRAALAETEADAERGLTLIMEASREDRCTLVRELSAEESRHRSEVAEVCALRLRMSDRGLDEEAREMVALRRRLEVQQGRVDELAREASQKEEACREELAAQALRFRDERDELRHELAVVVAKQRKELALEVAARREAEASSLGFEAQCAKLKASLTAEELLRERMAAQHASFTSDLAPKAAARSIDGTEGSLLPNQPDLGEAALISSFKKRLGGADQASWKQLEIDIDLDKQLILRAIGSRLCPSAASPPDASASPQ